MHDEGHAYDRSGRHYSCDTQLNDIQERQDNQGKSKLCMRPIYYIARHKGDGCRLKNCMEVEIVNAKREPRPTCSHTTRIGAGVCRNEPNDNRSKMWYGLGSGQRVLKGCEV